MLMWRDPERTPDGKYRVIMKDDQWPDEAGLGADFNQERDAKLAIQLIRAFDHYMNLYYDVKVKEKLDGSKKSTGKSEILTG